MKENAVNFTNMIREFLMVYLPITKASSPNTVKSYKNTLSLFTQYFTDELDVPTTEMDIEIIEKEHIEEFLDWLEYERECTLSSRNQRLAGLKAFFRYAAEKEERYASNCQELIKVPYKTVN